MFISSRTGEGLGEPSFYTRF